MNGLPRIGKIGIDRVNGVNRAIGVDGVIGVK